MAKNLTNNFHIKELMIKKLTMKSKDKCDLKKNAKKKY